MSGKTPGQIAYEGFVASQEPDGFEYETWADKDEHGDSATMGRADWEAAAQAVAAHAASLDADGSGSAAEIAATPDRALDALLADRNQLREALRRIALGNAGDPSVAADKALMASREHREVWEAVIDVDGSRPRSAQPAPEPAAATAETRRVLDLLDQATRAVLGKRWALTDSEKRIISDIRQQAGLTT